MSGSRPGHIPADEAGTESRAARSARVGGVWGDPRLSASTMAAANEGSRDKRHPLLWAAAWLGGFIAIIAVLILILR